MWKGHLLTAVALIGIAMACSDSSAITAPVDTFELPEPDMSLDPDRLVVGEYLATPCAFGMRGDGLVHLRNREEWVLVDVFFGRSVPLDGPTEADLEFIRAQEGRILHTFNVPAVRARILLSRIPDLVNPDRGHWITVREVPDPARYDLKVVVGFRHQLSDADIELIEALGGRVTHRFDFINGLSGILPDRSIPELHANPEVSYVELDGVACLA